MSPATSPRPTSLAGRLVRLGFTDPERAEELLADPALAGLVEPLEDRFDDGLLRGLSMVADPDLALRMLARLMEQDFAGSGELRAVLRSGGEVRDRVLAVLGASAALGDFLVRHPAEWALLRAAWPESLVDTSDPMSVRAATLVALRADLLRAVGADPDRAEPVSRAPHQDAVNALRVAYHRRLLAIAALDLTAADPLQTLPQVAADLADLASAALEAALAIGRGELPEDAPGCRIAVIGMGKCGGRELNYVSDVDVIYVVEPPAGEESDPAAEAGAKATGAKLAASVARACSASTVEGTLWPVDTALRPEGKNGPLVRTLESHVGYYQRWAETWEFQALLKARPVAGDAALGQAYLDAIGPMVWRASERANFVEDVQAMRRRVEQHVPVKDADRQLKLGAGGLRDVEFSVQLLQLVHGRTDPRLRTGTTLTGIEALSTYGYINREDASAFHRAYRTLRALEHRIQLYRLRRTHVVPTDPADLRRLGRAMGLRTDPADTLVATWRSCARDVRRLHVKLFYRPLLGAAAQLTSEEVQLTPEAARARLLALGYRDADGALRHLGALTSGVSRRAAIQRQLLPVMLGLFARGADPDAGLLAFRRVSEELGGTHWYLTMLRDSAGAAQRMAHVLASAKLAADLLERAPESVALLRDDGELAERDLPAMIKAVRFATGRHESAGPMAVAARAVRRREITRTAIAEIEGLRDIEASGRSLSNAGIAALDGGLRAAQVAVAPRFGGTIPARMLLVGMGRLGGGEQSYGSDADVIAVHEPVEGASEKDAQAAATAVITELRRLLGQPGPEIPLEVDPDLRPDGRHGLLTRTLDSYAEYYARSADTWEFQALTRARPVVGDQGLGERFVALVDPLRWRSGGIDDTWVREIRRIKARVEAERLPRGADPLRHTKLGRGGLADIEWTVQLLQLQHAGEVPGLRVQSTLQALAATEKAGLVAAPDARTLADAWRLASRVRNAVVLWSGRPSDSLPSNRRDLDGVARLVGYPPASSERLDEDYQRTTRRARVVVERLFYA